MTNLNTAFDVAEKYLDIPKMLDAEGEKAVRNTEMMIGREASFVHRLKHPQKFLSGRG